MKRCLFLCSVLIAMDVNAVKLSCNIMPVSDRDQFPINIAGFDISAAKIRLLDFCEADDKVLVLNGYEDLVSNTQYCYRKVSSINLDEDNYISVVNGSSGLRVYFVKDDEECSDIFSRKTVGIYGFDETNFDHEIENFRRLTLAFYRDTSFIKKLLEGYSFWGKLFDKSFSKLNQIDLTTMQANNNIHLTGILVNSKSNFDLGIEINGKHFDFNIEHDVKGQYHLRKIEASSYLNL